MSETKPDQYEAAVLKAIGRGLGTFLRIDLAASNDIRVGYSWRRTDRTLQKLRRRGVLVYDRLNGWRLRGE